MLLTLLTSNWGLAVSALIGVVAAVWAAAAHFLEIQHVQIGIAIFLAALWTIIGVLYLRDRTRPRLVRSIADYRYALTFEGIVPSLNIQQETAALQFGVALRNYSQAPIKFQIDKYEIRIETRTSPEYVPVPIYLPRGGNKLSNAAAFKKSHIQEFFGRSVEGTLSISIQYGHPEEEPVRRFRMKAKMFLSFPEDGTPLAFGMDIMEEIDEPYKA